MIVFHSKLKTKFVVIQQGGCVQLNIILVCIALQYAAARELPLLNRNHFLNGNQMYRIYFGYYGRKQLIKVICNFQIINPASIGKMSLLTLS